MIVYKLIVTITNNNIYFNILNLTSSKYVYISSIGKLGFFHAAKRRSMTHEIITENFIDKLKITTFKYFIIEFHGYNLTVWNLLISLLVKNHYVILEIIDGTKLSHNGNRNKKKN